MLINGIFTNPKSLLIGLVGVIFSLITQPIWGEGRVSYDESYPIYIQLEDAFRNGKWSECLVWADSLLKTYPRSPYYSSALLAAGEAYLRLRLVDKALYFAQLLIVRFPESMYIDRARLIVAQCYLLSGEWDKAEDMLIYLKGFATDEVVTRRVGELLKELTALRSAEILAEKPIFSSDTLRIGIILPLSGPYGERGRSFLKGFFWRWGQETPLIPHIWDSEGSGIKAARLVKELATDSAIWVVVGGMSEAEVVGIATTAQMVGIPFLTTSYTGDGLTSLGDKIFQGCATDRKLGESLGKWVVSQGSFKVGVVYPLNSYGKNLTEAFIEEVKRAGGKIIAEEGYYPGTLDLTPYLLNLRMRGWRFVFEEFLKNQYDLQGFIQWGDDFIYPEPYHLVAETLNAGSVKLHLSPSLLDSLWQVALKDKGLRWGKGGVMSNVSEETTPIVEDTLSVPTTIYQAVLLVIEPGMVGMVAPQWARVNFTATLVGNEFWGDPENLITNARYLEGMVFATASPIDLDWEKIGGDEILGEMGSDQDLVKAFLEGERAAAMVIFSKERSHSRDDFASVLGMIWGLETLSGQVRLLKAERVNRSVFLYRVRNGKALPENLE